MWLAIGTCVNKHCPSQVVLLVKGFPLIPALPVFIGEKIRFRMREKTSGSSQRIGRNPLSQGKKLTWGFHNTAPRTTASHHLVTCYKCKSLSARSETLGSVQQTVLIKRFGWFWYSRDLGPLVYRTVKICLGDQKEF